MKIVLNLFIILCLQLPLQRLSAQSQLLKLWAKSPAEYFINAYPVGNGRLAAMVYGRPDEELINLNEETLWSGGPINLNPNPEAPKYLPQIRKALDENNYAMAEALSMKMQGYFTESYAPLGDLLIKQKFDGEVTNYSRDLDLKDAISTTRFSATGVDYVREVFVSFPDQVIVIHLTSSIAKKLNFKVSAKSLLPSNLKSDGKELIMNGHAPSHADPTYINTSEMPVQYSDSCKGMRYQLRVKTMFNDGKETVSDDGIEINSASEVTLVLSAATSFNGFDKCPVSEGRDEVALAKTYFTKLGTKSYTYIKKDHISDFSNYFNRLKFRLGNNPELEALTTEERLAKYKSAKNDHQLEVLLYQYGRYLLISSSRPGGIAANLQGKWSVDVRPPWSCNYTTNINVEMNYWAAEKTGLGDMAEPLIQQVVNMSKTGSYMAKSFYNMPGWAAGHNSDIWATVNPVGHVGNPGTNPQWSNWIMAGAWLCQNMWDKYAYDGDKNYLQTTAYPVMKSAAEFCLSWLMDDGKGHLITSPSTSPENRFIGEDGKAWAVSKGATADLALIKNLFENTVEASTILGIDEIFRKKVTEAKNKMLSYQIGNKGNLQEWMRDYEESEPQHRHVSHLICLHPGHDVSANTTPELFKACQKSLEIRGDGGTGWSRAWKVSMWARLLDGNHAYKLVQNDLDYTTERGFSEVGGTYANLFNACPPFQIDSNFGIVEGISEMLLQSHLGEIHLLPALPDAWKEGSISGLKARGGYEVSMVWNKNKLVSATIISKNDGECKLRTNYPVKIEGKKGKTMAQTSPAGKTYLNVFKVKAGENIVIIGY